MNNSVGFYNNLSYNSELRAFPSVKVQSNSTFAKNAVFQRFDHFTKYTKNDSNTQFIKEYLFKDFEQKGIKLPEEFRIDIVAPIALDSKIQDDINHVVFKDFKGYMHEVFKLLSLPLDKFEKRVAELKVSDDTKQRLTNIHEYIYNYYEIRISRPGKPSVNFKELNKDEQHQYLNQYFKDNPELCKEMMNASHNLERLSVKFGLSEISRQVMYASGEAARGCIKEFVIGVLAIIGFDQLLVPPIHNLAIKIKPEYGGMVHNATAFIAGFDDDTLGGLKDRHQDDLVLGKSTASKIIGATIAAGIALSLVALKFNPVAKENVGKLAPALKYAYLTSAGLFTSTALTYATIYRRVSGNVQNGLIKIPKKAEFGLKNMKFKLEKAWENFKTYDVYLGKVLGFASVAPVTYLAVKSGATASKSGVVKALALILMGSVESYVATGIQVLRDTVRKSRIKSSQQYIVENLAYHDKFDPASISIKGTPIGGLFAKDTKNFINEITK